MAAKALEAVLVKSEGAPEDAAEVRGHAFEEAGEGKETDYEALFRALATTGFQGTEFSLAADEVNKMLGDDGCSIFFGFTSNMVSSGVRESIRFLCQHKLVSAIVTTGGAVEEDIMKCLAPHYMGDFNLKGSALRKRGLNRIGNLLVPNDNYCRFEEFLTPLLDRMLEERRVWTPSEMVHRLGTEVDNPDSVWYWCAKNDIPVFCPAITDGSIGDMVYFHSYKQEEGERLVIDIAADVRRINEMSVGIEGTAGMLVLGGGVVKHHIANAFLMRNGADYCALISTAVPFDGSDSGATLDEAVSWGKIRAGARPVKVHGDASLLFPLLVSQTFAKKVAERKRREQEEQERDE